MKKWKPILALVLVFLAGLVMGVVSTRVVTRRVIRGAIEHPDRVREYIERDLVRKLKLDLDQQAKVHATLVDSQQQLETLRSDFEPRFVTIMSNAQAHISEVLTPEQKVKFDKLREENRRIFPGPHSAR
jgi:hypothetical protein